MYERANEYNEDAFHLNVSKNRFKTFEEKSQLDHNLVQDDLVLLSNALCSTPGAIILPPFLPLLVDGRKRFGYATCGRNFFQKRRKKPPFLKISAYVWTGPNQGQQGCASLSTLP